jgi:hypothetical protein
VTLNADGSFTYTANAGFAGSDSFTYQANDGIWSGDHATPLSPNSNVATVTIAVNGSGPVYVFALTPLKSPATLGSAVPIIWQLTDAQGKTVSSLATLVKMESVFNGPVPAGGCVASDVGTRVTLYSPATGATGNSNFRYVPPFQFNWDTTTVVATGKGCYTVLITLNDSSTPRKTNPVQLK